MSKQSISHQLVFRVCKSDFSTTTIKSKLFPCHFNEGITGKTSVFLTLYIQLSRNYLRGFKDD